MAHRGNAVSPVAGHGGKPKLTKMSKAPEKERLLTASEAAALLQPYMPSKSALAWLLQDGRHDPLIPCLVRGSYTLYRRADLAHFVRKTFDVSATFNEMDNKVFIDRRGYERRAGQDRRKRLEVRLGSGIERRRGDGTDRRFGRAFDRRGHS